MTAHDRSRLRWPAACAAGALAVAVTAAGAPGAAEAIAYLLPVALLVGVLLTRRYPGERALLVMAAVARPRRRRAPSGPLRRSGHIAPLPRGGLLLACSLAVRPPPRLRA